jgi:hypothetical protein
MDDSHLWIRCYFPEWLIVHRSYIFYIYDIGLCTLVLVFGFLHFRLIMKIYN